MLNNHKSTIIFIKNIYKNHCEFMQKIQMDNKMSRKIKPYWMKANKKHYMYVHI